METEDRTAGARRWLIAAMGTLLQLCLGTVYAWSLFQSLLVARYGWSNFQVVWIFALAIFFIGISAAWGGVRLPVLGPRRMAMLGGLLFGSGYLVAALALSWKSLPLLYLGYGVVGGTGLGLGYVTPVATVAKWFPDKKGLATGMVIMGFGFGALLMSKVLAPFLIRLAGGDLVFVFLCLGGFFILCCISAASFLSNPPVGFVPSVGTSAPAPPAGTAVRSAIFSTRFVLMWMMFFCNITAGISIIGFQSPMMQELLRRVRPELSSAALSGAGATLIAASSLFNGLGRFFWGALSDRIGRTAAFRFMLGSQIAVFAALMLSGNPWIFAALICYVLLCYGGGFGTMPSFVLDSFGAAIMPSVYGGILTAWSAAGVIGPQIVALIQDHYPRQASTLSFLVGAGFLSLGLVMALLLRKPAAQKAGVRGA